LSRRVVSPKPCLRFSHERDSRSRERQQRFKIVIICGLERGDIGVASRAGGSKIGTAPIESLAAELRDENIGC